MGQLDTIEPTSSFIARSIWGINVIVGDTYPTSTREGTAWQTRFLDIKEGTSDRTVLEFDLRGRPQAVSVTLDFLLFNLDAPNFTDVFLYSFEGNGLVNAADYFRTDVLVTTFTDNGLATGSSLQDYPQFSLDVTSTYNSAIVEGDDYLGLLLRNTTAGSSYARYRLGNGSSFWPIPVLTVLVPEPSSMLLLVLGAISCSGRYHRRQQ